MNEFSRFIQRQMDLRGWRPADLVRRSGLSRQHVSKLLNDRRQYLGQMPSDRTIEGLAAAFEGISESDVREAAAAALGGYKSGEPPPDLDLQKVSLDALLNEIRRRVQSAEQQAEAVVSEVHPERGNVSELGERRRPKLPENLGSMTPEEMARHGIAARRANPRDPSVFHQPDEAGEENQDDGGMGPA